MYGLCPEAVSPPNHYRAASAQSVPPHSIVAIVQYNAIQGNTVPMTQAALTSLKARVLGDLAKYLAEYRIPPKGSTVGEPWSPNKVEQELDKMRELLVEPYATEYDCNDTHIPSDQRLPKSRRNAYVVAEDESYRLAFDAEAGDFVLIAQASDGTWFSWGIRGDACSTFLAR